STCAAEQPAASAAHGRTTWRNEPCGSLNTYSPGAVMLHATGVSCLSSSTNGTVATYVLFVRDAKALAVGGCEVARVRYATPARARMMVGTGRSFKSEDLFSSMNLVVTPPAANCALSQHSLRKSMLVRMPTMWYVSSARRRPRNARSRSGAHTM